MSAGIVSMAARPISLAGRGKAMMHLEIIVAFGQHAVHHEGNNKPRSEAISQSAQSVWQSRLRSCHRAPAAASMRPFDDIRASPQCTSFWQRFPRACAGYVATRPYRRRIHMRMVASSRIKPRRSSRSSPRMSRMALVATPCVSETAWWKDRTVADGDAGIDADDDPLDKMDHACPAKPLTT